MTRLALILTTAALLLPSAAVGAACSPLNCAPSQFSLAGGQLLGFRSNATAPVTIVDLSTGKTRAALPSGVVGGTLLVHQQGTTLTWYDASSGETVGTVELPSVARLVGVSQDGKRAVAVRLSDGGSTTFVIGSLAGVRELRVAGRQWDFDALRGDNLFLIRYQSGGGYQVRLLHVASGKLEAKPLKDPHESGTIWGQPYSRLASADGRYLFTLYIGSNGGSMVHALDLDTARARCIDLPGTGDYLASTAWGLALGRNGHTLWAANPSHGRVVGIDVRTRKVTRAFRIDLGHWFRGRGTRAALSPDGGRVALTDGESVAVVGLAAGKVVSRKPVAAAALGYSPAGRLWTFR
jgi:DNA-binding beta-propeller fold protein YncE